MELKVASTAALTTTISKNGSLFHEPWWLAAASGDQYSEVRVEDGAAVVGRLPFVSRRRFGFTILKMPPFTHTLGPIVASGDGKYQTRLRNRVKHTANLLKQLPKFDYFYQTFDSSCDSHLASADELAFLECGFRVQTLYTFHIDCKKSTDILLAEMHLKTRQHIRLAEKAYHVISIADPTLFTDFYKRSLTARGLKSDIPLERFSRLYSECRDRDSGEILAAVDAGGTPIAMTFVVWDQRAMYYLLSARAQGVADKGSVNLLIWSAMQNANKRGLLFDLDGVSTTGTAQFLAGFGGELKTRMIASCARPTYSTLQHFGRTFRFVNASTYR